ncbi:helix-turn-helix domain-containing protein [Lysinibacillus sphaericus]|uniref:helix-turn-helix domain-containing protein n=1 Tax=Lysinibacillus sphaericus TaxID=1421 RepID=UPI003D09145C
MAAFDRLKILCDEQKISVNVLEEKIGLGKNTLYSWKKKVPTGTNLEKVADYFNVSVDYLLGRTNHKNIFSLEEVNNDSDIDKKLHEILNELDDDDKKLLIASLENTLLLAKQLAKKKFM